MDANFYKLIIEDYSVGYVHHKILYDEDGLIKDYEFIEVNKAFKKMMGMRKKELIGRTISDIFENIKVGRSNWIDVYMGIKNSQENKEIEYYSESLDRYYEININYPDHDNLVVFFRDITEETKQKQKINLFSDSTVTQIWHLQDTVTYGFVNKAHADFLGFTKEELEFKNIGEFLCDDEARICISENENVFHNKREVATKEWFLNAKGENRLIKILKTPTFNKEGDMEFVICSGEDITEENRLKEQDRIKERILYSYMDFTQELLTNDNSYDALENGIAMIGNATQVDRVYFWENHYDEDSKRWLTSQKFEWCLDDVEEQIENPELQNIPYEEAIDFIEILGQNKIFSSHIRDMEYGPNNSRQTLEDQGILSILAIPVFIEGGFSGFIGFDSCRLEKEWSEVEVSLLKSFVLLYEKSVERQLLEKNIIQVKQNFDNFFNMVHDLLLVIDLEGRIININETALRKLDYSKDEIIGKSLFKLHSVDKKQEVENFIEKLIAGELRDSNIPFITKDGSKVPVETYVSKGLWDGEDVYFITSKDISDLKKSEEKFSKAFNSTGISILISSFEDGEFLEVNDSFLRMTGCRRDEIIGEKTSDIAMFLDIDRRIELKRNVRKNKRLYNYEIKIKCKDGKIKTGLCNIVPIEISGKLCLLTSILDVTERNFIIQELARAKEESDIANRAKSNFLSNMSHEIRTPMNAVIGYSELLSNTELTLRQESYASGVKASSGMLMSIINDILDWSKIDNNKLDLENSIFNIEDAIDNVVEQMKFKTMNDKTKIIVEKEEDIPPILYGDSFRFQQVLLNLISNSVKFTLEGEIRIKIEVIENRSNKIRFKFQVSDTGIGIPAGEIEEIFEPFKQVDNKYINQHEGTGLGLSICKQIIGLMGGEIEVESEMGQGTNFSFTTEFKIPSEEEILLKKAKDIYEGDGLYKSDTLVGLRVLLVDDNEINQDVLKSIVEEVGMLATVTSSGEEAVEKVRTDEYDIVLMDIRMPGMDGYEATAEIRKMKSSSELPIIAVTASASPDERIRCIESDIDDYITKPIDRKALFKSIANLLNRSSDKYKNLNSREKLNVDVNLTLIGEEESYRPSFQIEGIEIEEALNHLNNDEELFLKVLRKFERNHKKVVDEIREALALDDSELAIRLAHTIKGVSGELQAREIYRISCELESQMIDGNFKVEDLLTQLEDRLDLMFASEVFLDEEEDGETGQVRALDLPKMKSLSDSLEELLLESDFDAIKCIDEFEELAGGTIISDKAGKIREYGEQYDFDSALTILREIDIILEGEEER